MATNNAKKLKNKVIHYYSNIIQQLHFQQMVTAKAFETIYDWMIFNSPESNKFLRRDNILDLFCAAQYLGIKGKFI